MPMKRISRNKLVTLNVWEEDDKRQARAWRVDVKGGQRGGYEISIVRANNYHGFRSYGWNDPQNKVILFSGGGEVAVPAKEFNALIRRAHETARRYNELDGLEE